MLQAFVAVVDTGSFSRAAEQIHLSQPAVSKRIEALEQRLRSRVFDRIGKQVHLTPTGEALLLRARSLLAQFADIERAIPDKNRVIAGTLRFGASHHIGLHRLPDALGRFHRLYPEVRLDLQFLDSERGCAAVARDELEFAAVTLPTIDRALQLIPVWPDPIAVVVGRQHPLAGRTRVIPGELFRYPALLPAPGTTTRGVILQALPALDVTAGITSNHLEVLKVLTIIGLGWSALPETLIDDNLEVVHIKNVRITRTLGIVTHRGRTLSHAANKMIELIQETG